MADSTETKASSSSSSTEATIVSSSAPNSYGSIGYEPVDGTQQSYGTSGGYQNASPAAPAPDKMKYNEKQQYCNLKKYLDKQKASSSGTAPNTTDQHSASMAANSIERSWGDEVDDELPIDQLSVKERSELDDPDDHTIEAHTGDTAYTSAKRFEDLNLSGELLKGLYVEMRFERPSKIQAVTLPMILTPPYKNLIAQAHNGSGKTTCFLLGMLSHVDPKQKAPQALCICPTRESALQNLEVLKKMSKYTEITAEKAVIEYLDDPCYTPINKRRPITSQVIIGTPVTIKKLMSFRKLSMEDMKILVFDEADHMLAESGFKDDSIRIMNEIKRAAPNCQVLLFSATFSKRVKDFVTKTIHNYNQLFVKKEELRLESVKQFKVNCPNELAKVNVVVEKILELGEKVSQTIIYVGSGTNSRNLHMALVELGYEVTNTQGGLSLEHRDRIVQEFKNELTKVLISTDILARGFDQSQVNLVVNYDLPVQYDAGTEPVYEVYLHRLGRAGQLGRKGAVFNLISHDRDNMVMENIENHFRIKIAEVPSYDSEEGFEAALKEAGLL